MNDNPQSQPSGSARQPDIWESYNWMWHAIFAGSLAIPLIVTVFSNNVTADERRQSLLYYALLGLLYIILMTMFRRLGTYRRHVIAGLAYLLPAFILWYLLVLISPINYILLFSLYGQSYSVLPIRWAVPTSILLTALVGFSQVDGNVRAFWNETSLLVFLVTNVAGIGMGVWIFSIIRQSSQRRELIDQLEAAQAELAAVGRREGILAERQRLARDIHDTLAQGFTSIVMHLEAAEQALPSDEATVQHHLGQARQTARDSLDTARRVVRDLRPEILEKDPLPVAIQRTVDAWQASTAVATEMTTSGAVVALHPQVEVTLLRVTQEALANVGKHAGARQVNVTLTYFDDIVVLDVQDDGRGFDPRLPTVATENGGFGLRGMRERIHELGGTVQVESEPGEGTTLVVEIPVAPSVPAVQEATMT